MPRVEIINIGDELLIGQVINTNAAWIGQVLSREGIEVKKVTTIADKREEILAALTLAMQTSDIVLLTGGLGPTRDDITKEVLCEFFKTSLEFNEEAYQHIVRFFAARKRVVTELNRSQALLPASCQPLWNNHGTAAGMWFEKEGAILVSMPGVPYELKPMVEEQVIPRLRALITGDVYLHRTILTTGLGESFLAKRIEDWELGLSENLRLAYLPSPGIVRLRVSARGSNRSILADLIKEAEVGLRALIPELIFGYDDDTLEAVVGKLLVENKASLATAESCTGGYIAHLLTSVPGSSRYFQGSVVAYDNVIKQGVLGVPEELILRDGAVSEAVVIAMAEGVKKKFGADYALSTSGIAGPDGGSESKPVGTTWIALAGPHETTTRLFHFGGARDRNIRQAGIAALNILRLSMKK